MGAARRYILLGSFSVFKDNPVQKVIALDVAEWFLTVTRIWPPFSAASMKHDRTTQQIESFRS